MSDIRKIELEVDELDYQAICRAIARRQSVRIMPEGDGNLTGRVIAEICRGWEEYRDCGYIVPDDDDEGEEWKK